MICMKVSILTDGKPAARLHVPEVGAVSNQVRAALHVRAVRCIAFRFRALPQVADVRPVPDN
jgi:hypothetical protein